MFEKSEALADGLTLGNVAVAAIDENDWRPWGVSRAPDREGRYPTGVIVFERQSAPSGIEGTEWGTALWALRESTVGFFSGNYDLTREQAIEDFASRVREEG